jgi:hypothetical protein
MVGKLAHPTTEIIGLYHPYFPTLIKEGAGGWFIQSGNAIDRIE